MWLSGKIAAALGAPSLVGEIVVGVVMGLHAASRRFGGPLFLRSRPAGPHVVDFVPSPNALKAVGEIGLCLHALEAGLMVDVELLEIIGARGAAVGGLGSALPLGAGFAVGPPEREHRIARVRARFGERGTGRVPGPTEILERHRSPRAQVATAWGAGTTKAFVVGCCMASRAASSPLRKFGPFVRGVVAQATMSTGIALNVLKAGSVINQPIGQLIIAAATINEVVNVTLLTIVENMMRGSTPMQRAGRAGMVSIASWRLSRGLVVRAPRKAFVSRRRSYLDVGTRYLS